MTNQEAKQALAKKLNIDYSDIANNDMFSEDDLQVWTNFGVLKAWDYKPWDFTRGAKTLSLSAGNITNGYIDYPTDFLLGSVYYMEIGGKEYKKIRYEDFRKFLINYSGDNEKLCAEYNKHILFNPSGEGVAAGAAIDIYGKLKPVALSATSDLLPFSDAGVDNYEYSGNQAIVLLAYAEALGSEKKKNPAQAAVEEKRAYTILDILWKPFAENAALDQSKDRPLFDVPDFFGKGGGRGTVGKFNLF